MKQVTTLFVSLFLIFIMFNEMAVSQDRDNTSPRVSPSASVSQTIGTTTIEITYGRPGVRDREVFGSLVPFQEVWRAGADESTAITFSDDVFLGGERVEAGTYSLYTIPGEDNWTIIINEKLSWGTQYEESEDLLRVNTEPEEGQYMEQFMIYFQNISDEQGELVLHWDETKVPVTIAVEG